ncbi:MAG: PAS domain S-box protein [Cyanobacteria bacterium HKST-UBA02]|nr:PAS domain S-box protein [Cyanobacteria bacterium HKST-UBA02]
MDSSNSQAEPLTYNELSELAKKQASELEALKKNIYKNHENIRKILTSVPLALVVLSTDHKIEVTNKRTQEFFHYAPEELVGQPVSFLFPDTESVKVGHEPVRLVGRRKGGEMFVTEIYVNDLDIFGNRRSFVHIQDITERHRLEQLKQDLVAMVSHDLRTPLTSINGVLTLLDQNAYGELNPAGHRAIARAQSSSDYLISLVKDLLDAEKVESGTIDIERQETSVRAIIDKAISASMGAAQQASIKLESDITNDVLFADEDRIVQVLINLISNAIKYSPENSVVKVVAGIEGLKVKFQVIDQGPGIPEESQPMIFERYRQLAQPKGLKRRGFGLGLAICKAFVERHNGRIWVESEVGKGSRFCFTIPQSADR